MTEKTEIDLVQVLQSDGIKNIDWKTINKFENINTIGLSELRNELGMGSWAVRIAYNDIFGGVIIQQQPGEGNRKHYHPDADENWVIMDGEWEWWIEGKGTQRVATNSIVVVPKKTWHHIKCVKSPSVRYAITQPDVLHVYED